MLKIEHLRFSPQGCEWSNVELLASASSKWNPSPKAPHADSSSAPASDVTSSKGEMSAKFNGVAATMDEMERATKKVNKMQPTASIYPILPPSEIADANFGNYFMSAVIWMSPEKENPDRLLEGLDLVVQWSKCSSYSLAETPSTPLLRNGVSLHFHEKQPLHEVWEALPSARAYSQQRDPQQTPTKRRGWAYIPPCIPSHPESRQPPLQRWLETPFKQLI